MECRVVTSAFKSCNRVVARQSSQGAENEGRAVAVPKSRVCSTRASHSIIIASHFRLVQYTSWVCRLSCFIPRSICSSCLLVSSSIRCHPKSAHPHSHIPSGSSPPCSHRENAVQTRRPRRGRCKRRPLPHERRVALYVWPRRTPLKVCHSRPVCESDGGSLMHVSDQVTTSKPRVPLNRSSFEWPSSC